MRELRDGEDEHQVEEQFDEGHPALFALLPGTKEVLGTAKMDHVSSVVLTLSRGKSGAPLHHAT
jgi:hypothetical protein